jgi:hypothetical protein
MDAAEQKPSWKQRITREFVKYWINVLYLSLVLGLFAWYRRLILAHYEIEYLKYGVAIIEALILAKVILIAEVMGLGRGRFKDTPLIYPVLYKSVVFTLFLGLFSVLEDTIGGWFRGEGFRGWLIELKNEGKYEFLARCLIIFVVFIPYFAFKELGNLLGEGKLGRLFFRNKHVLAS